MLNSFRRQLQESRYGCSFQNSLLYFVCFYEPAKTERPRLIALNIPFANLASVSPASWDIAAEFNSPKLCWTSKYWCFFSKLLEWIYAAYKPATKIFSPTFIQDASDVTIQAAQGFTEVNHKIVALNQSLLNTRDFAHQGFPHLFKGP